MYEGNWGAEDQLHIYKTVMNDCRKRNTNLGMARVDYKKAHDVIPYSWVFESLKWAYVAENIIGFIERSMKTWNVNLSPRGKYFANVE